MAFQLPADTEPCPALPESLADVMRIGALQIVDCHGDAELRLRAWVTACDDCGGVQAGGHGYQPAWLAVPPYVGGTIDAGERTPVFFMTPVEIHPAVYNHWTDLPARMSPNASGSAPEPGQWIEVTGHFDDPASSECRVIPDLAVSAAGPYQQPFATIESCRMQFVVDDVVPVGAPD